MPHNSTPGKRVKGCTGVKMAENRKGAELDGTSKEPGKRGVASAGGQLEAETDDNLRWASQNRSFQARRRRLSVVRHMGDTRVGDGRESATRKPDKEKTHDRETGQTSTKKVVFLSDFHSGRCVCPRKCAFNLANKRAGIYGPVLHTMAKLHRS